MKSSLKLSAAGIATTLMLTACGGGGGEGGQTNSNGNGQSAATINGQYSATMQEGASSAASGKLSYSAGGGFARPASLQGTYGAFTFNELTGDWTYLVNNSSPATIALVTGQSVIDSLVINSADKAATITITITIEGNSPKTDGIAPVQNVPAPSYASTDRYAADKLAVFEMLNADRARCGFGKVAQSPKLDTAAQAHSDYLARNKTMIHEEYSSLPGYTGYGPGDRITKTGYQWIYGTEILTEGDWGSIFSASTSININNRLITEFKSTNLLKRLYATVYHLNGAMSRTTEVGVGISGYSNDAGTYNTKILNMDFAIPSGTPAKGQQIQDFAIATFPCEGSSNLIPSFKSEAPDPFPNVNRDARPYGHPIYIRTTTDAQLKVTGGSVALRGGSAVPFVIFDKSNDPNNMLDSATAFVVPTTRLADNSTYDVVISGTNSGLISANNPSGAWTKSFAFTTGTDLSE